VTQTSTLYAGSPTATWTQTACACATYVGNATPGMYGPFDDSGIIDSNMITMTQDGVINALEMYVGATTGGNIEMALYSDNGGVPGNLLATAPVQGSSVGWNVVNIPETMAPAGNYWIAWQVAIGVSLTADEGVTGDENWIAQTIGAFPGNMNGANQFELLYPVKADYCPVSCATLTPTPTPTAIPACMCATQFGEQVELGNAIADINGIASSNWYGIGEDGIATSMEVYVISGSGNARMSIYSTSSITTTAAPEGQPYALICESQPFAVVAGGWNTVAIPQTYLYANTVYWLTFECDDPSITVAADAGNAGDLFYRTMAFTDFPARFTDASSVADDFSILVNYCPVLCPPTPTPTWTVTATVTETMSPPPTATITQTYTIVINSPTYTATYTATPTLTYTPTLTFTQTTQVSPSNTPVTPVNTATMTWTPQATGTNTPQATATSTPGAAITPTATAGVIPIPYPNPAKPGIDDIKMDVNINKDASDVKFMMFTSGYRLIREIDFGSVPQGILHVDMDKGDFSGLSNAIYYFVIKSEYNDGTTDNTKPGKILLIN